MATVVSTLLQEVFSHEVGTYTTVPVSAAAYTELLLDFQLTSISGPGMVTLYRVNAFGDRVSIWDGGLDENVTWPYNIDIGPCDGYQVSHAFGDTILLEVTTVDPGTAYTGKYTLQGKGLA